MHMYLYILKKVKDIWGNVITHYDLTEIRNMDWGDIFVGLSGSSIRITFVNCLIIMLKYIFLSLELQVLYHHSTKYRIHF